MAGNLPDNGYLHDPQDPTPAIALQHCDWLPATAAPRGLFAVKDTPKYLPNSTEIRTITQYAGHVIDAKKTASAALSSHWKSIGFGRCIAGLHHPKKGYGMGQFCNHSPGPTRPVNCELVVRDNTHVLLRPIRDIQAGEELLIHYGSAYFRRIRDDGNSPTVDPEPIFIPIADTVRRRSRPDFLLQPVAQSASPPKKTPSIRTRLARHIPPNRTSPGYRWHALTVRPTPQAGYGVFAHSTITAGLAIPVLGRPLPPSEFTETSNSSLGAYTFLPSKAGAGHHYPIDGSPDAPGIPGCNGLAIALMLNEPDPGTTPNCIFKLSATGTIAFVIVISRINQGEQLTVSYSRDYDSIRPMLNYESSDLEAPAHNLHVSTLSAHTEQVRRLQTVITGLPIRTWDSYLGANAQDKWNMVCAAVATMNLRYSNRLTVTACVDRSIPPPYNLGVFSLGNIQAGHPVCGYTGQYLSSKTHSTRYADPLHDRYTVQTYEHTSTESMRYLDATDPRTADIGRWINSTGQGESPCLELR